MVKATVPAAICTWTSTGRASTPSNATVETRATMSAPRLGSLTRGNICRTLARTQAGFLGFARPQESRERGTPDPTETGEAFAKPMEGKSKSHGRKFKGNGSEIQIFLFRQTRFFNDLSHKSKNRRSLPKVAPSSMVRPSAILWDDTGYDSTPF